MSQPQSQSVAQQWQVTGPSEDRTSAESSASASCHHDHLIRDGTACIPGLGDFPFPWGGLAVLSWQTLWLLIPGDGSLGGPM